MININLLFSMIYPAILLFILYVGCGQFLVQKVRTGFINPIISISLSFFMGAGVVTFSLFLLGMLGISFWVGLCLGSPIAVLGWWQLLHHNNGGRSKQFSGWDALVAICLVLFLGWMFTRTTLKPPYTWDSMAFWTPKMFVLWQDQHVQIKSLQYFNHPEYPLLLPITGAVSFTLSQAPDQIALKAVLFLFSANFFVLIWQVLRVKVAPFQTLFWLLVLSSSFIVRDHMAGEYAGTADVLVAYYIAVGVLCLWIKQIKLAATFWAWVPWVKEEGMPFVLSTFTLLFLFKSELRRFLIGLGLILVVPWRLFVKSYGISTQFFKMNEIYARPWLEYAIYSVHAFREEWRNISKWGILWYGFFLSLISHLKTLKYDKLKVVVIGSMIAQVCSYLLIFTITPEEQATFIAAAISRMVLHLAPSAAVLSAWIWNTEQQKET